MELNVSTTTTPALDQDRRIRSATADDVAALLAIENQSFASDRVSRRSFRYLLSRGNGVTLVEEPMGGGVRGYAIVLFNRGTSLARLYSIAVAKAHRGAGVGGALLTAAERVARERKATAMRLEVRALDTETVAFYARHGYRAFAQHPHYYEDDAAALRMEKRLAAFPEAALPRIPYYAQSLDFTCGPAALLMAMHAHDPELVPDQRGEIRLWREATTVFMTSGPGGCSPEGLALAADRRGFQVDLYLSDHEAMFIDGVRSPQKREVIRLVQEDFREQLQKSRVQTRLTPLPLDDMRRLCDAGGVPVVLISSYRFDREKQPHWVVVTGFDDDYVYVHDPNADSDNDKTPLDCMHIPVLQRHFVRMARYGKAQHQAVLVIRSRVR